MYATPHKSSVTVQPVSIDMTLLETLKYELVITRTDTDEALLETIRSASEQICQYCDRDFAEANCEDVFVVPARVKVLKLRRYPVSAVSAVYEGEADVAANLLAASDYEWDGEDGSVYRLGSDETLIAWTAGRVTVRYTGGFHMIDELPRPLERACLELSKMMWMSRRRDPSLRAREIGGMGREEFWIGPAPGQTDDMPSNVRRLVDTYRRMRVGGR